MNKDFCTKVGINIKKYREEKQWTLKQLAEKVGITEGTMQKYEAGNIKRIDIFMLKKISDALSVFPENITEWGKEQDENHNGISPGTQEAILIKKYNQLTLGHKKVVLDLIESLIECQER